MKFQEDDVVLELPGSNFPEHTKLFVGVLLRMLNKGRNNPAYQLHALSLLTTGKSFMELVTQHEDGVEHMIEAVKALAEGTIEVITGTSADMSDITIDQFLGGQNE